MNRDTHISNETIPHIWFLEKTEVIDKESEKVVAEIYMDESKEIIILHNLRKGSLGYEHWLNSIGVRV